jgi:hypothetical protein
LLLLHFSDKTAITESYNQWVKLSFLEKH